MKKSKEAKFFCESCGAEVPKNAKVCNTCGKFFASVRCPQCGRTGNTEDFNNGCPTCGYAVSDGNNLSGSKNIKNNHNLKNKDMSFFSSFGNSKSSGKNQGDSSLPVWIYVLCVFVLILLIVILYSCL